MKRLLSFIIGVIFLSVLAFHNVTMAYSGAESMAMGDHSIMMSDMEDCHEEGISDCDMVCCLSDNEKSTTYSNVQNQNKKKFDTLKYSIEKLSYDVGYICESNLSGNLSPPGWGELLIKDSYRRLVGIIKSNS